MTWYVFIHSTGCQDSCCCYCSISLMLLLLLFYLLGTVSSLFFIADGVKVLEYTHVLSKRSQFAIASLKISDWTQKNKLLSRLHYHVHHCKLCPISQAKSATGRTNEETEQAPGQPGLQPQKLPSWHSSTYSHVCSNNKKTQ